MSSGSRVISCTHNGNKDHRWPRGNVVASQYGSTAVGQAVACAPVTQRARVRSPVVTSFLGEVFSGFSSHVRQMSGSFRPPRSPNIICPSLSSSIIIHYGRQWAEMLARPKTSNIHRPTYDIWNTFLKSVSVCVCVCVCVCSNANPLHYYVLRVPHKADRWRRVWSTFQFTHPHYVWDEYLYSALLRLGWLYV